MRPLAQDMCKTISNRPRCLGCVSNVSWICPPNAFHFLSRIMQDNLHFLYVLDWSSACLECVSEVSQTCLGFHARKTSLRQTQDNRVFRVEERIDPLISNILPPWSLSTTCNLCQIHLLCCGLQICLPQICLECIVPTFHLSHAALAIHIEI